MDLSQQALQISNSFSNYWPKNEKNSQTNSEAWILIKVQYVIYQWIRLDKLYKLMEAFFEVFSKFEIFFFFFFN